MKGRFISPATQRSRVVTWGLWTFAFSGTYLLASRIEFLRNTVNSIGKTFVGPVYDCVSTAFVSGVNHVRSGFVRLGSIWGRWSSQLSENMKIEWSEEGDFFTLFLEGNRRLFVSVKNVFLEMSRFMFVSLPEFIRNHSSSEILDYIRHYLRPIKMLFSRPELDRLQSIKTRFDQFVNAFKNPDFVNSLRSMNSFYIRFKDQISMLEDDQLAELIDVYLDDPSDMMKKVNLVMDHLGNDEESIKKNFNVDLMMDFIRSENVDKIRARLAASEVSSGLNKIASILNLGGDENDSSAEKLNESIENIFVSTVA